MFLLVVIKARSAQRFRSSLVCKYSQNHRAIIFDGTADIRDKSAAGKIPLATTSIPFTQGKINATAGGDVSAAVISIGTYGGKAGTNFEVPLGASSKALQGQDVCGSRWVSKYSMLPLSRTGALRYAH